MKEPLAPPASRSADRPHYWTIVLSVIAIALSLGSLYESHVARKLNEETSRAVIQITDLKLLKDWKWSARSDGALALPLEIAIYNAGKSVATNIRIDLRFNRGYAVENVRTDKNSTAIDFVMVAQPVIGTDDLGPGSRASSQASLRVRRISKSPYTNTVTFGMANASRESVTKFPIDVTVEYVDSATQAQFSYHACFEIPGPNGVIVAGALVQCSPVRALPTLAEP